MNTEKDDSMLLSAIEDKMNRCRLKDIPAFTGFLNMRQSALAQAHFRNTEMILTGGYEDAERRVALFLPEWLLTANQISSNAEWAETNSQTARAGTGSQTRCAETNLQAAVMQYLNSGDSPICVLRVTAGSHHEPARPLTHRDYLGAMTGLGVDRSICGDILVHPNGADLVVLRSMADYLLQNYVQAGRTPLSGEILPLVQLRQSEMKTEQKHDTVASLRLDCCIASVFSMSRGKAQEAIGAGLVAVNNLLTDKADRTIEEGDKVTLRGMGKARLLSVGKPTRKDRIPVNWEKYI